MADDVKPHESDVERHKLADVAHQLSYEITVIASKSLSVPGLVG